MSKFNKETQSCLKRLKWWRKAKFLLKGGENHMCDTQFVMWDEDKEVFEEFETEEDLYEYLEDNDYTEDDLENVVVFEVVGEFEVIEKKRGFELNEI
jgi:hypothetical protein